MKISILGGGAFGTALAIHFSKKVDLVSVWEFFDEQAKHMQERRESDFLPGHKIADNVTVTSDMEESLKDSHIIIVVVPSSTFDQTMQNASAFITNQDIIICSKGLGKNNELLSDIVKKYTSTNVYCLYGPTIAAELADGILTGMVLAGENENEELTKLIQSDTVHIDTSTDIIGAQVASALKNVVTIFVGIIEGGEYGDNTKSLIFVRGLHEIKKLGIALGGTSESFFSLTGLGDMLLHSRNRMFGQEIGKRRKVDEVLKESGHVVEGLVALQHVLDLSKKLNIKLEVIEGLNKILYEDADPKSVLKELM